LAHELIVLNGCTTTNQTQFPLCATEKDFLNESISRNRLGGISLRAFRRVAACQPYQFGPDKYSIHPLWHLHKLSNLDKHKTLALAAFGTRAVWQYINPATGKVRRTDHLDALMYDGAIVGSMPASFLDEKVQIQAKITAQVSFRDPSVVDLEVLNVLHNMREFIGTFVLPLFYPFFHPVNDDVKLVTHGLPPSIVAGATTPAEQAPSGGAFPEEE
jgi:hypothetical protein